MNIHQTIEKLQRARDGLLRRSRAAAASAVASAKHVSAKGRRRRPA